MILNESVHFKQVSEHIVLKRVGGEGGEGPTQELSSVASRPGAAES